MNKGATKANESFCCVIKSSLVDFLAKLDCADIAYVSWKNNHELEDSLVGRGDLDLFIAPDNRSVFMSLATEDGWIELVNPVAHYPSVCHLYRVGLQSNVYHLHVYFRMITGESWLKEFELPLEDFLLENRQWSKDYGVWVLSNDAQKYLFGLRHLLKGGSVSSRLLYRRELDSYQKEWEACDGPCGWLPDMGPLALTAYVKKANLDGERIALPKMGSALSLRRSLWPFLRFPVWSLSLRRFGSFSLRAINKVFLKRRKIFPHGGLVIAISGVDGAGKSTMLGEMKRYFSGFLTVETFQLGRPQGRFLESMRRLFMHQHPAPNLTKQEPSSIEPIGLRRALASAVLAWTRLRVAKRAIKAARKGHMVLVDRWPTSELGKMDGPRISLESASMKGMIKQLGRFENWAYSRMPQADICVFLTVSIDSALARNRDRIKDGKESDQEIIRRFEENQAVKPIAKKVILFYNDGEFETMREQLKELIWSEVSRF